MGARIFSLALGAWLFVSSWLWVGARHAARLNGIICGLLVVAISALSFVRRPVVKYLDTLLALWLFFSGFVFSRGAGYSEGFVWNVFFVAFFLFIASLAPIVNPTPLFRFRRGPREPLAT